MVEIARVRAIHRRHGKRFFDKVFTRNEQAYCLTKSNPYPSLAARLAAKEAVAKAFGTGIGGVLRWVSVSVEVTPDGVPQVILDAEGLRYLKKLKAKRVLLSLSHTDSLAIAMATLVQ